MFSEFQEFVTTAWLGENTYNPKFDSVLEYLKSYKYVDGNETFSRSGFTLILEKKPDPLLHERLSTHCPTDHLILHWIPHYLPYRQNIPWGVFI